MGTRRWESELWGEVHMVLKVVQTAACLEIFNAMVGIVRSPWVTVLMQGRSSSCP